MRVDLILASCSAMLATAAAAADEAFIVDIDASRNGTGNPVYLDLGPGHYIVTPIARRDGGRYDAWLASNTNPESWTVAYAISSSQFPVIEAWDQKIHATPEEALEHGVAARFILGTRDRVGFYNFDEALGDNVGGTSILVSREKTPFRRGDANADGRFDIGDPIVTIVCLFFSVRDCPRCPEAADANDDGVVDVSDPVYLLNWQFLGEAPPPEPFPACGVDLSRPEPGPCAYPSC
jgi:hypothetical protein